MHDELFQGVTRKKQVMAEIRELFRELGGAVSMSVLADEAVERDVIPPEMVEACQQRGLTALCRQAMKVKTADGLPFAKPIGGSGKNDDATWSQLDLFTYDQAVDLVIREATATLADVREVGRLHQWCLNRFGQAPDLPELGWDIA